MILEDVSLKDLDEDDSSPYYYRTRVMEITTDKGKYSTPSRCITRTEHIARSKAGISKALPKDLAIDFRIIVDTQVENFFKDSKVVKSLIQKTKQFNDYTRKSIFRLSVFQPAQNALDSLTTPEKIKFADSQADFLQIKLGTNLITFPYLALPVSEYLKFIDSHYRRDEEVSTIFVLDLAMEPLQLEKILNHLVKKDDPMIIAVIYRDWEKTAPQHAIIASHFNNKKIAFFACQVPRQIQAENNTVSNLHSVAFGSGFDIVSLEQPRGFGKSKNLDLNKIRFFSPQTLQIDNIVTTLGQPGRNLIEEFNFNVFNQNDKDYLDEVIAGFRGASTHPKKFDILLYIAKMHEALNSTPEFDRVRNLIKNRETVEYIKSTLLKNVPMIKIKHA